MRFLVDAQLPPGLARYLASRGHEAEHVYDIGMGSAPDREVWDHAVRNNAVLVTKDDDFVTFKTMGKGGGPPVVWVRLGNTTNRNSSPIWIDISRQSSTSCKVGKNWSKWVRRVRTAH